MNILVTGGAGFIGSHMVWRLIEAQENVVVIDRLSTGFRWAVAPDAIFIEGDIANNVLVEDVIRKHNIEAIIHFAGSIVVTESMNNPLSYYFNNTVNSHSLIKSAIVTGVKNFVFSSTAAVYGPAGIEPLHENAPCQPESPYGMSKLMTEYMLRDTAKAEDFRFAALRYFNVAGADPLMRTGLSSENATHLIKVVSEVLTGKRSRLQVFGTDYNTPDGTCVRDYIHVWDLVDAHYAVLNHLKSTEESVIANCGYGTGYSVREVIATAEQVYGKKIEVEMSDRRPGDSASTVANSDLLRKNIGWTPQFGSLEKIVTHAIEWEEQLKRRTNRNMSSIVDPANRS